jgi:SHS2 domain-containing protein
VAVRPTYREIEHTADVGMELDAPDLRTALERSAAAMFDLICDLESVGDTWRSVVSVESRDGDLEHLLVRWLTELLYVHESERVLLGGFSITRLDSHTIEADVTGEETDPDRHAVRLDIKAVTYHDIVLEERPGRWDVRVIFDT